MESSRSFDPRHIALKDREQSSIIRSGERKKRGPRAASAADDMMTL
jgi:hypothetical protein